MVAYYNDDAKGWLSLVAVVKLSLSRGKRVWFLASALQDIYLHWPLPSPESPGLYYSEVVGLFPAGVPLESKSSLKA